MHIVKTKQNTGNRRNQSVKPVLSRAPAAIGRGHYLVAPPQQVQEDTACIEFVGVVCLRGQWMFRLKRWRIISFGSRYWVV